MSDQQKRILIGVSGSVATIKLPNILKILTELEIYEIKVIFTSNSTHFVNLKELQNDYKKVNFYQDQDEWKWQKIGDEVLHIELKKWADIFVVCPLSANTMAKFVNGLCDNLLTCVFRAWDFKKPVIVAPAMNTFMYENPITGRQILQLKEMNVQVIDTVEKLLACGDKGNLFLLGNGAMAEPKTILDFIQKYA